MYHLSVEPPLVDSPVVVVALATPRLVRYWLREVPDGVGDSAAGRLLLKEGVVLCKASCAAGGSSAAGRRTSRSIQLRGRLRGVAVGVVP